MASKFRALQATKDGDRQSIAITELTDADLMDGDVVVAIEHSTVNLGPIKSSTRENSPGPAIRWVRNAGLVRLTRSEAGRWPTCSRRSDTTAP